MDLIGTLSACRHKWESYKEIYHPYDHPEPVLAVLEDLHLRVAQLSSAPFPKVASTLVVMAASPLEYKKSNLATTWPEAMRIVNDLQCAEPRDKIYGVLAVMESEQSVRVDYTKDVLVLALEVMETYFFGDPRKFTNLSHFGFLIRLVRNLRLQDDSLRFWQAIEQRQPDGLLGGTTLSGKGVPPRHAFLSATGCQIDKLLLHGRYLKLEQKQQGDTPTMETAFPPFHDRGSRDRIEAILCAQARPDDWLCYFDEITEDNIPILMYVVRRAQIQQPGVDAYSVYYTIIGHAIWCGESQPKFRSQYPCSEVNYKPNPYDAIIMHMDLEDLLLSFSQLVSLGKSPAAAPVQDVARFLETSPTRTLDSSFAQHPVGFRYKRQSSRRASIDAFTQDDNFDLCTPVAPLRDLHVDMEDLFLSLGQGLNKEGVNGQGCSA